MAAADSGAGKRVVAIVGRPNVGKSAIFNRLAGRRIAIVHEESGVTRDRLMREVEWGAERFTLIDTGGVCALDGAEQRDEIEAGVRAQVEAALGDAAAAILAVDVTEGVVPLDLEVAGLLRSRGRRAVVAANKADNPDRDALAAAFEELGFPVHPVSALHGRGFDELMASVIPLLPDVPNPTVDNPLKVAVVGRPNVGKSSYINRLLREDRLIVSRVPGTTRDSVHIPFSVGRGEQARHYVLIDTAGLRRGASGESAVEKYSILRAEESIGHADVAALVMDAAQGPTAQDKRIASMIEQRRKGCVLLVNKWDLMEDEAGQGEYREALWRELPFMRHCPLVFLSAATGYNIRRTVEAIDHVAAQTRVELPTGMLNRALLEAYRRVSPPAGRGGQLKIFYAAQVGQAPIRIRVFVNQPHRARPEYREYLVRCLRERFGLEGAPVLLELRERRPAARSGGARRR
jgi:GTP-binding protein